MEMRRPEVVEPRPPHPSKLMYTISAPSSEASGRAYLAGTTSQYTHVAAGIALSR